MIEINNLTTAVVDEDFLKKTAKIVIDGESSFAKASEDKERKIDLSIALVGQERIKKLNKKYRGKNRATDVLSFSYDGSGDIVICLGEVKKNAKRFGTTFKKELAFCLIHGILHLLGEDHEKEAKPRTRINSVRGKKIEEKQQYYLKICQGVIL